MPQIWSGRQWVNMMTKSAVEAGRLAMSQDDVTRKLRHVALAIPAIALLLSAGFMALEPRFGLLGVGLILGWTQLAGL